MPRMMPDIAMASSFWGISATAWSAFTAIGTLALAGATVAAIWVGTRQRHADRQDFDRRLLAERRERQDDEARQVSATVYQANTMLAGCTINVSAPVGYQVSQLTVNFATDNGGLSAVSGPDVHEERDGRTWWRYDARRNNNRETPMISFTDQRGTLYYQYGGITRRFDAGTTFSDALPVLRDLLKGGPADRQPSDDGRRGRLRRAKRGQRKAG